MAVFTVAVTYLPNGNQLSRPIVADDADDARKIAEAEWEMKPRDPDFTWQVTQRADPDGSHEAALLDMERRRLEMEARRW